ncbi:hypothetical protein BRPE64_ECDS01150 (plasmid) [Caballeronia insecticola]|uniref:Uncharacterized protein n=1 Tax=Caballeronia insecticola TaxID=758793 RepID=A0A060PGT6_9BURK|nr:hypothetical protein BRPE64_ECDS01150 [Caballeronia insecticola]
MGRSACWIREGSSVVAFLVGLSTDAVGCTRRACARVSRIRADGWGGIILDAARLRRQSKRTHEAHDFPA